MSQEPTLKDIFETLVELRKEFNDYRASAGQRAGASGGGGAFAPINEADIPQPATLLDSPGDVQIHFGKNNGKPLSELSERSLSWYASEQPPRLDSSGKPYPPRPQETTLKNAARQLWHLRKGTLKGVSEHVNAPAKSAPKAAPAESAPIDEEQIPF